VRISEIFYRERHDVRRSVWRGWSAVRCGMEYRRKPCRTADNRGTRRWRAQRGSCCAPATPDRCTPTCLHDNNDAIHSKSVKLRRAILHYVTIAVGLKSQRLPGPLGHAGIECLQSNGAIMRHFVYGYIFTISRRRKRHPTKAMWQRWIYRPLCQTASRSVEPSCQDAN